VSEVSREEFDELRAKVDALSEVLRRVADAARHQLEDLEARLAALEGPDGEAAPEG
jgi:hypothetical protein